VGVLVRLSQVKLANHVVRKPQVLNRDEQQPVPAHATFKTFSRAKKKARKTCVALEFRRNFSVADVRIIGLELLAHAAQEI
jgi:hypothetical protein